MVEFFFSLIHSGSNSGLSFSETDWPPPPRLQTPNQPSYFNQRQRFFNMNYMKDLFENVDIDAILYFQRELEVHQKW